jgi:hypothetical protein
MGQGQTLASCSSQRDAIVKARELMAGDSRFGLESACRSTHIVKQTTAADGTGLVVVTRAPKSVTYTVQAELIRQPANAPIDGWFFFGVAPS